MFLAEALLLRRELRERQGPLKDRIRRCLVVDEGKEPPEDPEELLREYSRITSSLARLIGMINITNAKTVINTDRGKMTLTEAAGYRAYLETKVPLLKEFADKPANPGQVASLDEIQQAVANAEKLKKDSEHAARDLRKLVALLQKTDWSEELVNPSGESFDELMLE